MRRLRAARAAGGHIELLGRDPRLDAPGLRTRWIARTKDPKLGGIPGSYQSGSTCPDACGLRGAGCYPEQGLQGHHWRVTSERGAPWSELLEHVRRLPEGALWRYGIAGDLPGERDKLDRRALDQLVEANRGRRGFAFTHKPLESLGDALAVERANAAGFTVNLSADGLRQADERLAQGIGPVVAVVPSDTPAHFRTPGGARGRVCPAQVNERVHCAGCGLCAQPSRKLVIGFRAHGNHARRVSLKVMM